MGIVSVRMFKTLLLEEQPQTSGHSPSEAYFPILCQTHRGLAEGCT